MAGTRLDNFAESVREIAKRTLAMEDARIVENLLNRIGALQNAVNANNFEDTNAALKSFSETLDEILTDLNQTKRRSHKQITEILDDLKSYLNIIKVEDLVSMRSDIPEEQKETEDFDALLKNLSEGSTNQTDQSSEIDTDALAALDDLSASLAEEKKHSEALDDLDSLLEESKERSPDDLSTSLAEEKEHNAVLDDLDSLLEESKERSPKDEPEVEQFSRGTVVYTDVSRSSEQVPSGGSDLDELNSQMKLHALTQPKPVGSMRFLNMLKKYGDHQQQLSRLIQSRKANIPDVIALLEEIRAQMNNPALTSGEKRAFLLSRLEAVQGSLAAAPKEHAQELDLRVRLKNVEAKEEIEKIMKEFEAPIAQTNEKHIPKPLKDISNSAILPLLHAIADDYQNISQLKENEEKMLLTKVTLLSEYHRDHQSSESLPVALTALNDLANYYVMMGDPTSAAKITATILSLPDDKKIIFEKAKALQLQISISSEAEKQPLQQQLNEMMRSLSKSDIDAEEQRVRQSGEAKAVLEKMALVEVPTTPMADLFVLSSDLDKAKKAFSNSTLEPIKNLSAEIDLLQSILHDPTIPPLQKQYMLTAIKDKFAIVDTITTTANNDPRWNEIKKYVTDITEVVSHWSERYGYYADPNHISSMKEEVVTAEEKIQSERAQPHVVAGQMAERKRNAQQQVMTQMRQDISMLMTLKDQLEQGSRYYVEMGATDNSLEGRRYQHLRVTMATLDELINAVQTGADVDNKLAVFNSMVQSALQDDALHTHLHANLIKKGETRIGRLFRNAALTADYFINLRGDRSALVVGNREAIMVEAGKTLQAKQQINPKIDELTNYLSTINKFEGKNNVKGKQYRFASELNDSLKALHAAVEAKDYFKQIKLINHIERALSSPLIHKHFNVLNTGPTTLSTILNSEFNNNLQTIKRNATGMIARSVDPDIAQPRADIQRAIANKHIPAKKWKLESDSSPDVAAKPTSQLGALDSYIQKLIAEATGRKTPRITTLEGILRQTLNVSPIMLPVTLATKIKEAKDTGMLESADVQMVETLQQAILQSTYEKVINNVIRRREEKGEAKSEGALLEPAQRGIRNMLREDHPFERMSSAKNGEITLSVIEKLILVLGERQRITQPGVAQDLSYESKLEQLEQALRSELRQQSHRSTLFQPQTDETPRTTTESPRPKST